MLKYLIYIVKLLNVNKVGVKFFIKTLYRKNSFDYSIFYCFRFKCIRLGWKFGQFTEIYITEPRLFTTTSIRSNN